MCARSLHFPFYWMITLKGFMIVEAGLKFNMMLTLWGQLSVCCEPCVVILLKEKYIDLCCAVLFISFTTFLILTSFKDPRFSVSLPFLHNKLRLCITQNMLRSRRTVLEGGDHHCSRKCEFMFIYVLIKLSQ